MLNEINDLAGQHEVGIISCFLYKIYNDCILGYSRESEHCCRVRFEHLGQKYERWQKKGKNQILTFLVIFNINK